MVFYKDDSELLNNAAIKETPAGLEIINKQLFREKNIDCIVATIVLTESSYLKKLCYWVVYNAGLAFGVVPASISGLYSAMGDGKASGFTIPAINIRTLTYDLARAAFKSAIKINAGAFIFEIAKSEIDYTNQRPLEYISMVILAAIKEGYQGPIFLQSDHFQINAGNYLKDSKGEVAAIKEIISESISSGFYNVDIDTSTLVDLSKPNIDNQQELNFQLCAQITKYIRSIQPKDIEISIGGEIGEVGGKNSTPEELEAFMKGYLNAIGKLRGISKISIQTGTSHGGVVLPDGTIAKVKLDFETLKKLSQIARKTYGLSGCVQQGASTLPNEAFHNFPEVGCSEIHLATQFQNIVYDYMPIPLKEKIYEWLHKNYVNEKESDQTDGQFIYKTRKNALGAFKKEIFSLSQDFKNKIVKVMEEEFDFLFDQLKIKNTKPVVEKYVKEVITEKQKSDFLK